MHRLGKMNGLPMYACSKEFPTLIKLDCRMSRLDRWADTAHV